MPAVIPAAGLSAKRQGYLYSEIRPFVPDAYKDELCPPPPPPPGQEWHYIGCLFKHITLQCIVYWDHVSWVQFSTSFLQTQIFSRAFSPFSHFFYLLLPPFWKNYHWLECLSILLPLCWWKKSTYIVSKRDLYFPTSFCSRCVILYNDRNFPRLTWCYKNSNNFGMGWDFWKRFSPPCFLDDGQYEHAKYGNRQKLP